MYQKLKQYLSSIRKWCKQHTTLALFIMLVIVGSISAYSKYDLTNYNLISYQQYQVDIASGGVEEIRINQLSKQVEYTIDNEKKRTVLVEPHQLPSKDAKDIPVKPLVDKQTSLFSEIIWVFIKAGFFSLIASLILRSLNDIDSKDVIDKKPDVTFDDVKGVDVGKAEFIEVIDQFKRRDELSKLGISAPRGVLLSGPPGCGKTMLAKAAANSCSSGFIEVTGSEFNEMFYGIGSLKIRALFAKARAKAPCIIFFDEAESVLGSRSFSEGSSSKSNNQTLNQILTELDGFKESSGVLIIASTNFPDMLDKAVTRPGRIDQKIVIELPEAAGREELLNHYLKNHPIASDVNTHQLAFTMYGMTGSDIDHLIRQAKILSTKLDGVITNQNLQDARDRILLGQKKNVRILEEEREITAYHEGGHALIAHHYMPHLAVDTVTIAPRGSAGGYTLIMPKSDHKYQSKVQIRNYIITLMGGRAAEQIIYGQEHVTTGASNDLEVATKLAYDYVAKFGFSSRLSVDLPSTPLAISASKDSDPAMDIAALVEGILQDAFKEAVEYLTDHQQHLEDLKVLLLEHETISAQQLNLLLSQEVVD